MFDMETSGGASVGATEGGNNGLIPGREMENSHSFVSCEEAKLRCIQGPCRESLFGSAEAGGVMPRHEYFPKSRSQK